MKKLKLSKPEDIGIFLEPYHSRIMRVLKDNRAPMTVKEIAGEMGEIPAKVYYHVKKLESIGVLYIKFTRQINGIVAKYYDFAAESFSLSVPDKGEKRDLLRSEVMREYGQYFDQAKQKFFDLYNYAADDDTKNNEVYITIKNSFMINPERLEDLSDEISALIKKYQYNGEGALDYSMFCSIVRNVKPGRKKSGRERKD